ncbi:MAG: membrane protein insertase YidC [Candidatus Omnitrophota bacterium]
MNPTPQMGKNYWAALVFSLAILLGYPYVLNWLHPRAKTTQPQARITQMAPEAVPAGPRAEAPATAPSAQDLYLGKPAEPELFRYENQIFDLEFSTLGGTITRLVYKGETTPFEIGRDVFYEQEITRPGFFGTSLGGNAADLVNTVFTMHKSAAVPESVEFVYEKAGDFRLTKRYLAAGVQPVISLAITLENLSGREKIFPLEIDYGLQYDPHRKDLIPTVEGVTHTDRILSADAGKIAGKGFSTVEEIDWAGVMTKYYAILLKPGWKAGSASYAIDGAMLEGRLKMTPIAVAPGEKLEQQFFIYAGPKRYEVLKSFDLGFEGLLTRGFFGLLKTWFLVALKFFYGFTSNYGWAIILLTCVIKLIFTPLTHMSFESMKKMQALQPKLKALQERYKGDPQKLNREMMQLYKRNKVNPMGGCLPMVLQIPIFIAFYQVLNDAIELKGAGFVGWIHDLAAPDRLATFPVTIPFLGDSFNLLPLFMIVSMVWQQKLTPQMGGTTEQQKVMTFMPLIFGFAFYNMPSGLVLYWFVNNMLSIIHQTFVKRVVVVLHPDDES